MNHWAKNMNIALVSSEGVIGPSRRNSPTTSAAAGQRSWTFGSAGGRWRPVQRRSVRVRQVG